MSEDARAVIEHMLERTAHAMLTGDLDLALACFDIPYTVETFAGEKHYETVAEFREQFFEVVGYYRANGVTQLDRRCVLAEFQGPDTISTLFETRIIQFGTMRLREIFPTYSLVRRRQTGWRVTEARYAIDDSDAHNRALVHGLTPTGGNWLTARVEPE